MIYFYWRPKRYLIAILLIRPERLQFKDNFRGERRRQIYLERPDPRPRTLKTSRNVIARVVVLEHNLRTEIDRLAAFLFDEGLELLALGFGAGFEGLAFGLGGVVELVVDVEGGHREDLEEGFSVVGDCLEIAVGLAEDGGVRVAGLGEGRTIWR